MESVMRRILQLSLLGLAAGAMNACKPEEVISTTTPPTAGVRFIHAVPDTGIMDFRAVDGVDFVEHHGVAFRSASGAFYKNAIAGSRHIRIFMSVPVFSTLPAEQQQAIASTVMADTTLTLEADHRYTFLLWGFARTGSSPSMHLTVLDDNPADPGTAVALRLVNAGAGLGAVDGREYPSSGSAPTDPTWANVAELTASSYVTAPTGSIKFNVTAAGTATALFTPDATALAGSPATIDLDALPGTTVAGSAVSGFLFPPSVAGSPAATFANPGMTFWWDRRPPRPPGV
jgi:hypothetical protein